MAQGLVKKYPAVVRPLLEFCLEHEVNIFQMPCPESRCLAGGIARQPRGKQWYEENGLRAVSREIAREQVRYMASLVREGFEILAIVGVDFSPACAVNYLNKGRSIRPDRGIYMEELQECLKDHGIRCRFVGVNQRWERKLQRELQDLLSTVEFVKVD